MQMHEAWRVERIDRDRDRDRDLDRDLVRVVNSVWQAPPSDSFGSLSTCVNRQPGPAVLLVLGGRAT